MRGNTILSDGMFRKIQWCCVMLCCSAAIEGSKAQSVELKFQRLSLVRPWRKSLITEVSPDFPAMKRQSIRIISRSRDFVIVQSDYHGYLQCLLHSFCSRFRPRLASRAVSSSLNLSNLWPCGQSFLWCHYPLAGHFVTCKVLATSPNMWSRWVATLKVKIRGFAWICRVKPGKETHKSICDFTREKFVCVTGRIFSAIGFPPNGFRHTARGSLNILLTKESLTSIEMRSWRANPSTCSATGPQRRRSMSDAWDLTSVAA